MLQGQIFKKNINYFVAVPTGFEPAISAVTRQHINQLCYGTTNDIVPRWYNNKKAASK
jgi:hypothetical protein